MAKPAVTTQSGATLSFTSIADLGYKQAQTSDSLTSQAQWALENIAGFPSDITLEAKAELYTGYQKRYSENNPAVTYAVINGHYVIASPEHEANKSVEKIAVGFDFAYSMTSQDFGKLKNTEPEKHAVIAKVREKVQTYCSNKLGDLKRAANKLVNVNSPRSRTTLDFVQSVAKVFDALEKSVKVKQGKGDTTANQLQYRMAKDAFWKAYNAK
jgi:hypothetical protein